MLDVRTHTDGGQTADAVAERVLAWLGPARRPLDLALYDVRRPDEAGGEIKDAAARGVAVRIAFNQDEPVSSARTAGTGRPSPPPTGSRRRSASRRGQGSSQRFATFSSP